MAKGRKRRIWSDVEKRMICAQTRVPGVSVSQVARRYDVNANLVFTWRREPVEQRGGHLGIAEDGGPLGEDEVGGDEDRSALVEAADQVEQELAAGLGEGRVLDDFEQARA